MTQTQGGRVEEPVEAVLLERALDGDNGAFGDLLALLTPRLLRFARSVVHNEADAEDVVQDAALLAYRNLQALERGGAFTPWLYRINLNCARSLLRQRGRAEVLARGLEPAAEPSPEQMADAGERARRVRTHVLRLAPKYRDPVLLWIEEELPYDVIGRRLGVPGATIKVRIHRAKQMLRRKLAGNGA